MDISQDQQTNLVQTLEAGLDDIEEIVRKEAERPEVLIPEVIQVYAESGNLFLENAANSEENRAKLKTALEMNYHEFHEGQERDNGDLYVVHTFQTGFVLSELEADILTTISGIKHDSFEENPNRILEVYLRMMEGFGHEEGTTIATNIRPVSSNPDLDTGDKKLDIVNRIYDIQDDRVRYNVSAIRVSDRISNFRTLNGMKAKKGRTKEQRIQGVIDDTIDNVLPLAEIVDNCGQFGTLKLVPYLQDLITNYQQK